MPESKKVYVVVCHDTTEDWLPQENPVSNVFATRESAQKWADELNETYLKGIDRKTINDEYPEQEDDAFGEFCYYKVWEMELKD